MPLPDGSAGGCAMTSIVRVRKPKTMPKTTVNPRVFTPDSGGCLPAATGRAAARPFVENGAMPPTALFPTLLQPFGSTAV